MTYLLASSFVERLDHKVQFLDAGRHGQRAALGRSVKLAITGQTEAEIIKGLRGCLEFDGGHKDSETQMFAEDKSRV